MIRSGLNASIKLLGLSLILLSGEAQAKSCVHERLLSALGKSNTLAPRAQMSSTQVDRLAVEASDLIYGLFKDLKPASVGPSRTAVTDQIKAVVLPGSWSTPQRAPAGYRVVASWDDSHSEGAKQGAFAAIYEPNRAGDPVIFAFKGTKSMLDLKEDLFHQGGSQLKSVFRMMSPSGLPGETAYSDLLKRLQSGQNVMLTGHSLGGGLAQATAYLLQKDLEYIRRRELALGKNTAFGKIHLVTFNAIGGRQTLNQFYDLLAKDGQQNVYRFRSPNLNSLPIETRVDEAVVSALDARNYAYRGDPVAPLFEHLGRKIIVAKEEKRSMEELLIRAYMDASSLGVNSASEMVKLHSVKNMRQVFDPNFKF